MSQQWFLCNIEKIPVAQEDRLRPTYNLAVKDSKFEGHGSWLVWLPIIPSVGDTLHFRGAQLQVSKVILLTNTDSQTGFFNPEVPKVSANLHLKCDVFPNSFYSRSRANVEVKRANYALRGIDLQYYIWELRHHFYCEKAENGTPRYERWHSRIRPVVGDTISVGKRHWQVAGVELSSACEVVDGLLFLQKCSNIMD